MTSDVSLFRLYYLRFIYGLIFIGLGLQIWPAILHHAPIGNTMHGVARCMLGALSIVAALGIRYPLRMLPLLFFELAWKALWLLVIALPLWSAHQMDPATQDTARACLMAVIILPAIPWRYVFAHFVRASGDRWR